MRQKIWFNFSSLTRRGFDDEKKMLIKIPNEQQVNQNHMRLMS